MIGLEHKMLKCKLCSLVFSHQCHLSIHMEGHNKKSCAFCDAQFLNKKALNKHLKQEHDFVKKEWTTCLFCKKRFSRKTNYIKHLESHTDGQHFCSKCGFMCDNESIYTIHVSGHVTQKNCHECNLCGKQFGRQQQYEQHMMAHERHRCSHCNITVSTKKLLLRHKKEVHGVKTVIPKSFSCNLCQKGFLRENNLQTHMRMHTGDKPVRCSVCEKSFRTKRSLTRHEQSVRHLQKVNTKRKGEVLEIKKHHMCMKCGTQFYCPQSLSRHIEISHSESENHKCPQCTYSTKLKANLKRHIEGHCGVKRFICEFCGSSFRQHSSLNDHHAAVHSEKRSFICNLCPKSFKSRSILVRHIRHHDEARPYKCQCAKDFKRLSHLKRHMTFACPSKKNQPSNGVDLSKNMVAFGSPVVPYTKVEISLKNSVTLLPTSTDDLSSTIIQSMIDKKEISNDNIRKTLNGLILATSVSSPGSESGKHSPTIKSDLNSSPANYSLQPCINSMDSGVSNSIQLLDVLLPSTDTHTLPNLNTHTSSLDILLNHSTDLQNPNLLSNPKVMNDLFLDNMTKDEFDNADKMPSLLPYRNLSVSTNMLGIERDNDLCEKYKQENEDGANNQMAHNLLFPHENSLLLDFLSSDELDSFSILN